MEVYYALIAKKINVKSEKYNKFICKNYKDFLKFETVLEDYKLTWEPGFSFFYSLFNNFVVEYYDKNLYENISYKYKKMQEIKNNNFLSNKKEILSTLYTLQKHYLALSKFVHIVKFKIAKNGNTHDMFFNTLNANKTLSIVQDKKKYLFSIFDLKEIINKSLSNIDYGFPKILPIKNPYNNIPFTQSNLYNIYFFYLSNYYVIPPLFHSYFLANFDIALFEKNYEYQIKKHYYTHKCNSYSNYKCVTEIKNMLSEFNKTQPKSKKFESINEDFPNLKLIQIMKPYLQLYILSKHSPLSVDKQNFKSELKYKLNEFIKFNPKFGRKYSIISKSDKKKVVSFEDKSPPFNQLTRVSFSSSHIDTVPFPNYFLFDDDDVDEPEENPDTFHNNMQQIGTVFSSPRTNIPPFTSSTRDLQNEFLDLLRNNIQITQDASASYVYDNNLIDLSLSDRIIDAHNRLHVTQPIPDTIQIPIQEDDTISSSSSDNDSIPPLISQDLVNEEIVIENSDDASVSSNNDSDDEDFEF